MGQSQSLSVKFPEGGDVVGMRKWLDYNKFTGLFTGWDADALLGQSDEFIKSRFDTTVEGFDKAARLCGLLNSARNSKASAQPARSPFESPVPSYYTDLFEYFRVTPPPECYGTEFMLPVNLRFLFDSKSDELNRLFIVRQCYECILSIVNKTLKLLEKRGNGGIIFSGAQGNGKTWLSLFIVWELVFQGKTVVYELCEQEILLVIPVSGPIRLLSCAATIATVPELSEQGTIHVFDAKASGCRQPAATEAYLVMTTARNRRNYAQTARRPNMHFYCIPSYKVSELLLHCARFGVTEGEVLRRCAEIGPSIRYILVSDYENCKNETMAVARIMKAEQLEDYMGNVTMHSGSGSGSGKTDMAAGMLVVLVREDLFDDPDDAYLADKVSWEFASTALCRVVLSNVEGDAAKFVKKLVAEVNARGDTNMAGLAGNFLELIVRDFICAGHFEQCRQLGECRDGGDLAEYTRLPTWEGVLTLQETNITTVPEALAQCTDRGVVYNFCKTFPGADVAALGFSILFQVTNSGSHPIQLSAIREICEHVRKTEGEEAKVKLLFVAPEAAVKASKNWQQCTQSFEFDEEEKVEYRKRKRGSAICVEETVVTKVKTRQLQFANLPVADQHVLRNLEQWVVCYKE